MELNGLTSTVIRPGDVLRLPSAPAAEPEPEPEPVVELVDAENVFESNLRITDGVTASERLSNWKQLPPEDGWKDGEFKGLMLGDDSNRLRLHRTGNAREPGTGNLEWNGGRALRRPFAVGPPFSMSQWINRQWAIANGRLLTGNFLFPVDPLTQ